MAIGAAGIAYHNTLIPQTEKIIDHDPEVSLKLVRILLFGAWNNAREQQV